MRPVIFLHTPKVGGTTLRKLLRRWPPPAEIRKFDLQSHEVKFAGVHTQPGVRLVLSHGPFGLHETFAVPVHYITLLREPVERVISHFHYVLQSPHHFQHEAFRRGEVTLLILARRRFDEQIARQDPSFTRQVACLRYSNRAVDFAGRVRRLQFGSRV